MRVGLVGCVKQKQATPVAARDLYVSALFRGRRAMVEQTCDRWYILSALHGLVHPDQELAPYDLALLDVSTADRRRWSRRVVTQLSATDLALPDVRFEVHAGAAYRNHGLVDGVLARGATVEVVGEHLRQGELLAFYANRK